MTANSMLESWEIVHTNQGYHIKAGDNGYIMTLVPACRGIDCAEDINRLIAAAPELLEALRGCAPALTESAKQHRQCGDRGHASIAGRCATIALEAIAKATGANSD